MKELEGTLVSEVLCQEFRKYLREQLDRNCSQDPGTRGKMEVWLELVVHCRRIFSLPEAEVEGRRRLMVEVSAAR